MIYVTFDTCVWLELLKANYHAPVNIFEEVLFLIEKRHITCITTENLNREWQRNKSKKKDEVFGALKKMDELYLVNFKDNDVLNAMYRPEKIADVTDTRIARIDQILESIAEKAEETDPIRLAAANMNLKCLPPNHRQDSFRDTVNIMSLIKYLEIKKYTLCFFVTINHTDFSMSDQKKHDLHEGLTDLFASTNLTYIYFDTSNTNAYAGRFRALLKNNLPSFADYLMERKRQEEQEYLTSQKLSAEITVPYNDSEFLENIEYIDRIIRKKSPTAFEKQLLNLLFSQNEAYRKYFMKKISPDGMV
jgi:hypothetical protein